MWSTSYKYNHPLEKKSVGARNMQILVGTSACTGPWKSISISSLPSYKYIYIYIWDKRDKRKGQNPRPRLLPLLRRTLDAYSIQICIPKDISCTTYRALYCGANYYNVQREKIAKAYSRVNLGVSYFQHSRNQKRKEKRRQFLQSLNLLPAYKATSRLVMMDSF